MKNKYFYRDLISVQISVLYLNKIWLDISNKVEFGNILNILEINKDIKNILYIDIIMVIYFVWF